MSKREFLSEELNFLFEIDKLKSVYRQTVLIDKSRNENSAEHSWQLALAVITFLPYLRDRENFDELKAIKMALAHDIVEIDAGDTLVYSDNSKKYELELAAAERIFSLCEKGKELMECWLEFEDRKTPEASFVSAIDRMLPILMNIKTSGHTWKKHNITYDKVVEFNRPKILAGFPEIWPIIEEHLSKAVENGFLLK